MSALISKPGITSVSTLSIPVDWDKVWFRNFIQNQLKGADVRNAIGANGISITGNNASPYATIGFGAPVTLPAPVTINATGTSVGLTINGAAAQIGIFNGSGANTWFDYNRSGVLIGRIGSADSVVVSGAITDFGFSAPSGGINFATGGLSASRMTIGSSGNVTINAPTSGAALVISGVS